MIKQLTAMPTYEEYKDSGVEWLGEIPAHWKVIRVKNVFRLVIEPSEKNNDHELLSIYTDIGVKPRKELEEKGNKASTTDGYWLVKKGDFIVNKLLAWMGAIGLSEYEGVTSPAYDILRPTKPIDGYFYHYLFRTRRCTSELKKHSRGIMEMRLRLYFDKFGVVEIPYPSKEEQTAIVTYIETRSTKIDQAISIKEQQIALLKERKQILIQNAVTRGLDPNVPMRDSGVEWIGEIPEHWAILANRVLLRERVEPGEDGLPLLSVSIHTAVSSEEISEDENIRGRIKIEDKTKYNLVQPGDIVFNMMRAWQGAIGAVKVKGMVSPAYIIAVPNEKIVSSYFEYQYRCPEFIQQMDRNSKGITDFRKRLYWGEFKQLVTVVPPIEEQTAIVAHIETESAKIDQAISIQQQQIDKLKEYKATLINSAVTGKIKMPELVEGRVAELTEAPMPEPVEGELIEDGVA
jgi:type I restriction enzyme S subunit